MQTIERLKTFAPKAPAKIIAAIERGDAVAKAAGLTTPLRVQHFLAQLAHESGGLARLVESLNYSTAERIRDTWPSRFPSIRTAAPFVKKPQALANKVYNGRMGNAEGSNDGWTYRGRGLIQTTGKDGYERIGDAIGQPLVEHPELLEDPDIAFAAACKEWELRGCNAYADRDDLLAVSKAINLGSARAKGTPNGMPDRREWLEQAKEVFAAIPAKPLTFVAEGGATYPGDGDIPLGGPKATPATQLAVARAVGEGTDGGDGYVYFKPFPQVDAALKIVQDIVDDGYPEVGQIDGKWASKTFGAISRLAAVNDLPAVTWRKGEPPRIPVAVYKAITGRDFKTPPVSKAREAAKTADILEDAATTIAPTLWQRLWGRVQTSLGGIALAIGVALVGDDGLWGVPPVVVGAIILVGLTLAAGGSVTWLLARLQVLGTKEAYRAGKIV